MAKGDPNEPVVLSHHRYQVSYVPEGCTDFYAGQFLNLYVEDPAPTSAILNPGGPCDGVTVTLFDPA